MMRPQFKLFRFCFCFFFRRNYSREQSRACKGYSLKCDKGMTTHIFSFDEIWTRKNLTTFGLHPVTTLFERGTECEYIHSKGNLSALSNAVSGQVVRRIGRELFDLKARGDIFLNHPVHAAETEYIHLVKPDLGVLPHTTLLSLSYALDNLTPVIDIRQAHLALYSV